MPIKIPSNLPAHAVLSAEGVMVMDPSHADRQDIRPLRIALLNLMPLKIQTENQNLCLKIFLYNMKFVKTFLGQKLQNRHWPQLQVPARQCQFRHNKCL